MKENHDLVYDQNQLRIQNVPNHIKMQYQTEKKFRISTSLRPEITYDFGALRSQRWKFYEDYFIFGQETIDLNATKMSKFNTKTKKNMLWTRIERDNPKNKW
jgi:hypothetical protein